MELPRSSDQNSDDSSSENIDYEPAHIAAHGNTILQDSKALSTRCLFTHPHQELQDSLISLIPNEIQRKVIYALYADAKKLSIKKRLKQSSLATLISLAQSFHALQHRIPIEKYLANALLHASGSEIEKISESPELQTAIDALVQSPNFFYRRAPRSVQPIITELPNVVCGTNPVVLDGALWSIDPKDRKNLWFSRYRGEPLSFLTKVGEEIAVLCAAINPAQIFCATALKNIFNARFYSTEKRVLKKICQCEHGITTITASADGSLILASGNNKISIIKPDIGIIQAHALHGNPIDTVSIFQIETKDFKSWVAVAVERPQDTGDKLVYWRLTQDSEPSRIIKRIFGEFNDTPLCAMPYQQKVRAVVTPDTGELTVLELDTNTIMHAISGEEVLFHQPPIAWEKITDIATNGTGDLTIARAWREKTGKSLIIWDHSADVMHELPDLEFETVVPGTISSTGLVSFFCAQKDGVLCEFSLNARPFAALMNNPKTSLLMKLFFIALSTKSAIDFSDPQKSHWKKAFDELPQEYKTLLLPHNTTHQYGKKEN